MSNPGDEDPKKDDRVDHPRIRRDKSSPVILWASAIIAVLIVSSLLILKLNGNGLSLYTNTRIDVGDAHVHTDNVVIALAAVGVFGLVSVAIGKRLGTRRQLLKESKETKNDELTDRVQPPLPSYGSAPAPQSKKDYEVVSRWIIAEFTSKTSCKCSHEVTIRVTTDTLFEVYDGRYPRFDENKDITIDPPHKLLRTLDESGGWIQFLIRLHRPLSKGHTTNIKMNFEWLSKAYEKTPDAFMIPFCKTDSITFVIKYAPELKIAEPIGEAVRHFGTHEVISTNHLEVRDDIVTWNVPNPSEYIHYRVRWKWA